jgi:Carbohydrate family 9 binding domain-like
MTRTIGLFALAFAASACVSGGSSDSHSSADDAARLKPFILSAAPADVGRKLDIDFDGKVTLLGCRIVGEPKFSPGQLVKLTFYWRLNQKLDKGWSLFTHVLDASGERVLNVDNVGPLREIRDGHQALMPSAWEVGKVYVDEQSFTVPASVKTPKLEITTGLWRDNDRMKVVSGPHDSTNRALAARLFSADSRPVPPRNTRVPSLRVDKLDSLVKIQIDGKLDEEAWKTAASTGPLVDVQNGEPNTTFPVKGSVKLLWNDEGFYVGFEVTEADIVGGFKKGDKDPHLWTKDTAEIMVDPEGDGDNKDYYEIQIGPQNLVFDSQFDDYNQPKIEPSGPFGHQEWSANLKSAVKVEGTLDKSSDQDTGYTVEAAIPWKSFSKAQKLPPIIGSSWRMNFYAMKNNSGVAWSAILGQGNFHKASRFGRVLWAEKGWAPPARSIASPGLHLADGLDRSRAVRMQAPLGALRAAPAPAPAPGN